MKKASDIIEKMRTLLHSQDFVKNNKMYPQAFTRKRVLAMPVIFSFILNQLKRSISKEVFCFCKYCNIKGSFTNAAVTKARAKLKPESFVEMNRLFLREFYNGISYKEHLGFIVLAIDGSTIELPNDSSEILRKYGGASNQTKTKVPMARISGLYDVENQIVWDAIIAPYDSDERSMAIQHIEAIKLLGIDLKKLLIIFDRGYPSFTLIVYLLKNGIEFLIRRGSNFLKEITEIVKSDKKDEIIQISLKRASPPVQAEIKRLFPDIDINETIRLRIIVDTLSTNEKEVLITSLLDQNKYKYRIFIKLYAKRWGKEENYKFLKVYLELENFSGKSCIAVEQDFHATVLAANVRALLALEANEEKSEKKTSCFKERKYDYKINKNVSMEALKNELVYVLLDPLINIEQFCRIMKNAMKQNPVPIRKGRCFERKTKNPRRRYHMNQR